MLKSYSLKTAKILGLGVCASFSLALVSVPAAKLHIDLGDSAFAQEAKPQIKVDGCKSPPEKRKLQALPKKFFKKVEKIDELLNPLADKNGNVPEPNYRAIWPMIEKLVDRCDDCSRYEWASLYQRAAFVRYSLEDIPGAIKYFQKELDQSPDIPESLETQLLYQVAQLLTSEERYDEALKSFDKWEAMCPNVVSEDYYYYRAQIYYAQGKKDQSLRAIERIIDFKKSLGEIPKEGWYKMQFALYLDKENYKKAESIAEEMVVHYTKLPIVSQLAQLYGLNGKEKEQLAMTEALRLAGGITSESQQKNIAFLYLQSDAPILAARVLQEGLKKDLVKPTSRNLETLAAALSQAQEFDEAIPIMEKAASLSDEGKIYAQLAGIYLNSDKFKETVTAGNKALKKKGLRSEGEVHMYIGSAQLNLKQYDKAIASFRKAASDEKYKKYSAQLIKYATIEKKRDADIAKTKARLEKS